MNGPNQIHVSLSISVYIYIYTYLSLYTYRYEFMNDYTSLSIYLYIYIYIYIYIDIYIYCRALSIYIWWGCMPFLSLKKMEVSFPLCMRKHTFYGHDAPNSDAPNSFTKGNMLMLKHEIQHRNRTLTIYIYIYIYIYICIYIYIYRFLFLCCITLYNINTLPFINEFGASEFGASAPQWFHFLTQNENETSIFLSAGKDIQPHHI